MMGNCTLNSTYIDLINNRSRSFPSNFIDNQDMHYQVLLFVFIRGIDYSVVSRVFPPERGQARKVQGERSKLTDALI